MNCLLRMHRIAWRLLSGMVCTRGMPGTASHGRAMKRRCHCVHPEAAPTHTVQVVVGGSERSTRKDLRSRISASAHIRRGLRQPSYGLHGRRRATAPHQRPSCRWVADLRYPCCDCHGLSCPGPPRPCCCTGTSPPLAHEIAMSGSCHGILAWCIVCRVRPAASARVRVGKSSPSDLVVRPTVVAPPAVRFCICPGAAPRAYSCSAYVRPCAQRRCSRCPPGSGAISECFSFFYIHIHILTDLS